VASRSLFAVKVTVAICVTNALGAYLYWSGSSKPEHSPRN
jgi:hypothetical protein